MGDIEELESLWRFVCDARGLGLLRRLEVEGKLCGDCGGLTSRWRGDAVDLDVEVLDVEDGDGRGARGIL